MNELSPKAGDRPPSSGTAPQPAPVTAQAQVQAPGARRRRVPGLRLLLFVAILAVLAGLAAYWARASLLYVHETDARIRADLIAIASEIPGRVVERPVNDGDRVAKGQVLLRLDAREAALRLEETDAQQAMLLAGIGRLDAEMTMIRARAESRIARAGALLTEAAAAQELYEHELTFAKADYERARALGVSGAISSARLERAHTDYLKARQELTRARAEIASAEAGVGEAEAELSEIAVKQGERNRLEAALTELAARRERLRIELEQHTIVSPSDGVVGRTFVSAGERIDEGQRLMTMHDPAAIWVEANIRETEIGRLAAGQRATVHVDAYPGEVFEGRIDRIGHAANSQFALLPRLNESGTFTKVTQRIEVRIAVEQRDGRLRPGMMVEVSIDAPDGRLWPF